MDEFMNYYWNIHLLEIALLAWTFWSIVNIDAFYQTVALNFP